MMSRNISGWVGVCHAVARSKGWWDESAGLSGQPDPRCIPEKIALAHSELSECLEAYRAGEMKPSIGEDGKPEGFPSELADVLIRCFDLAGAFGIDLEQAVIEKHEFNKTRPHRHGGKAC